MLKKFIIRVVLPVWYRLCCLLPRQKKVLFIEIREKDISNNFVGIIAALRKHDIGKNYTIRKHLLKLGRCSKTRYFFNCVILMPRLATAKFVFINESSNIISSLKIRKGTQIIQTWHGCGALKKFGNSLNMCANYYGNENMFLISSENVREAYKEATNLEEEKIFSLGIPRTDIFFQEAYKEKCNELKRGILNGRNKKVILFAPTFRGNVARAKESKGLNLDLMYKSLGQEYIVISKYHNSLKADHCYPRHKDFYYDVTDAWTIEEAMGVCDILITDYSSLIFEYALLNKPAIFYAYDLEEYKNRPGFYIDYENEMPGAICESTREIIKEINSGFFDVSKMQEFKEKYMDCCDGHSTRRLLDTILVE